MVFAYVKRFIKPMLRKSVFVCVNIPVKNTYKHSHTNILHCLGKLNFQYLYLLGLKSKKGFKTCINEYGNKCMCICMHIY